MMDVFIAFSNWIAPIFYKIVYMSMVGSILGIFIFCLTKWFDSKLSAKWKCVLWLIPLCFFMLPFHRIQIETKSDFVVPSLISEVETSLNQIHKDPVKELPVQKTVETTNKEFVEKEESSSVGTITITTILPILWLIGAGISIVVVAIGNIKLSKSIKHMPNLEDSRIRLILKRSQRRLQVTKKIEIKLHHENGSPCIYGISHPKILVSDDFVEKDTDVIENIFMHELSHYKRKDMISNCALLLITAIHWFNPLVYLFFKKIRQEMELATDEIALSRMDKEEKKQYGLTLINLLQTYQTERVGAKMLCIKDDNKNMERRIRKIKFATKLKKYKTSIAVLASLVVLCIASLFILQPTNAKLLSKEEQALYEMVKQYIIDLEQENQKRELAEDESNFKTFIDLQELGTQRNEDETYVYVWALVQNYDGQSQMAVTGSSMPYKFTIRNGEIIGYAIPKDGSLYQESIEAIFPKDIIAKMKESEKLVNSEKLEMQAREYYQNLSKQEENKEYHIGTNMAETVNVSNTSEIIGKWKPFKAEDENGEEINLRDVYGSGISTYGGELIISKDGTYTEFIGVYANEEIDNFQGTYDVYEEEEGKIILNSNRGENKLAQIVDNNILKVTFETGLAVYFSK